MTTATGDTTPTHRDFSRVILRNSLVLTVGQAGMRVLNVLFVIYAVRLLGEEGWGSYATVVSFVGLFGVFFELGLSQYVERSIARDRTAAQALFWNLVALRLMLSGLGLVTITTLAFVIGYDADIVFGVGLQTSTFILAAFLMPLTTVLTANERFDLSTAAQFINQIVTLATGLLLLTAGFGFLALLYTGFVGMPLQMALCVWAIRRHQLGPLRFQVHPRSWPDLVRAGLPFGLTSLALTFSFNADSVMLGLFHGAGAVGIYNAAYRLVFNLSSLAGGFLTSMTPSLAREHVVNAERVSAWVRSGLQLLCTFALPVAVGGSLLAGRIVATLYGPEFAASGMVLAIVIWTVPFHLFNAFSGNVTAAVGLERPAARIFLTSAALNVALNLVLIPRYGVNGAAAVTVASDGLASLRLYRLLHSELQLDDLLGRIGRIVVAATVMGVVVYLASALPLGVLIPLGMLVYGILAFVLRIIDPVVLALPRRMFALLRPGG